MRASISVCERAHQSSIVEEHRTDPRSASVQGLGGAAGALFFTCFSSGASASDVEEGARFLGIIEGEARVQQEVMMGRRKRADGGAAAASGQFTAPWAPAADRVSAH